MFFSIASAMLNKKITTMDFSQCQLKSIPPELIRIFLANQDSAMVSRIRCFNFKHNEIQNIPQELLDLPDYVDIKLEGNPLDMIPDAYRRSNWLKVREYLMSIRDRAKQWRDCKLLLLGQESAGKSTLLKCLMNKKSKSQCKQNLSTNGISIHRQIKFQMENEEEEENTTGGEEKKEEISTIVSEHSKISKNKNIKSIQFNAWDFGGQEVFYPTHRFFLTNNAVYIITFNLSLLMNPERKIEAEGRISYWMQQVRLSTISSKQKLIYLVGTHLDSVMDQFNQVEEALEMLKNKFPRQRFPGMRCVIPVSCKTGEGIKKLKILIQNDVIDQGLLPLVPPSWVKLYDYIFTQKMMTNIFKNMKHDKIKLANWITRKKFDDIAKRCGLESIDIQIAAEFLQDIGVVILHQNHDYKLGIKNNNTNSKNDVGLDGDNDDDDDNDNDSQNNQNKHHNKLTLHRKRNKFIKDNNNIHHLHLSAMEKKNIVILKPQWLADVMSTLISFNHTWIRNGFLRLSDVPHVFNGYEESVHESLLEMLENFSIIYRIHIAPQSISLKSNQISGIHGVFVPSVLPETPDTNEFLNFWSSSQSDEMDCFEIGRNYCFPFLPLGLIERIIVRAFHIPGFIPHYFWRNGAFLFFRSFTTDTDMYKIYIVFDPTCFQLTLRMRSISNSNDFNSAIHLSRRASIFSLVIDSIDTSLEEYKLGDITERFVPCTHCVESQIKQKTPRNRRQSKLRSTLTSSLNINNLQSIDYTTVFLFTYSECISSMIENDGILFCHHIRSQTRAVDVQNIAPDIALAGVPFIKEENLKIEKQIGMGGFGKVYKGILIQSYPLSLKSSCDDIDINDHKDNIEITVAIKEATVSFKEADYVYSDFRQEVFIMT